MLMPLKSMGRTNEEPPSGKCTHGHRRILFSHTDMYSTMSLYNTNVLVPCIHAHVHRKRLKDIKTQAFMGVPGWGR
jgi:hypothetical protein